MIAYSTVIRDGVEHSVEICFDTTPPEEGESLPSVSKITLLEVSDWLEDAGLDFTEKEMDSFYKAAEESLTYIGTCVPRR